MTSPAPTRTPIQYFRLAKCSLLITPPVRGRDLRDSVTKAIIQGFQTGADMNQIIDQALRDTSEGSLYHQVASQIEDSKRAQRANAVQQAENVHSNQAQAAQTTYNTEIEKNKEAAEIVAERHRKRMEEVRERAQRLGKQRSAVETRIEAFHERVTSQLGATEAANLENLLSIHAAVMGDETAKAAAKAASVIVKRDMRLYARTVYGMTLAEGLQYTPTLTRIDFEQEQARIAAFGKPGRIKQAYTSAREFFGI